MLSKRLLLALLGWFFIVHGTYWHDERWYRSEAACNFAQRIEQRIQEAHAAEFPQTARFVSRCQEDK